ncbi:hypothetical protein IWQ62_003154 [Dispira parvispora]|uniref:non-specific serine/threonine protein kinase n=1 Tax=Dispira parvispora TaxID=1520584 RepID=A0A9W8AUI0_9FUNG|nr:hypothetical protein IWQ62_003154 [Dispira parvispora]
MATAALENRLNTFYSALMDKPTSATSSTMVSLETLLDMGLALYEDCQNANLSHNANVPDFIRRFSTALLDIKESRVNKHDFTHIKPLTKGQFGTVSIVRSKINNQVYAMKVLEKKHLLRQRDQSFFMEERDVLIQGNGCEFFPSIHAAFQDERHLYLVMEYVPGGDLFSLLDRSQNAVLSEADARFYIAEIILAINHLHKMGYAHRDIKPQNILIDAKGHIRLADFGSCIRLNKQGMITSQVPVGTCDYISPEVLKAREGNFGYTQACDWWSLGIVIYEMLYGDPPFYSESIPETYAKIMTYQISLEFDDEINAVSVHAKDLIQRLLCEQDQRLGRDGVADIMAHPFFEGLDWATMRQVTPPFLPDIKAPDDTSYFSPNDEDSDDNTLGFHTLSRNTFREFRGEQLPFIGYTYSAAVVPAGSTWSLDWVSAGPSFCASTPLSHPCSPHRRRPSEADLQRAPTVGRDDTEHAKTLEDLRKTLEGQMQEQAQRHQQEKARLEATVAELEQKVQTLQIPVVPSTQEVSPDTHGKQSLSPKLNPKPSSTQNARQPAQELTTLLSKHSADQFKDLVDSLEAKIMALEGQRKTEHHEAKTQLEAIASHLQEDRVRDSTMTQWLEDLRAHSQMLEGDLSAIKQGLSTVASVKSLLEVQRREESLAVVRSDQEEREIAQLKDRLDEELTGRQELEQRITELLSWIQREAGTRTFMETMLSSAQMARQEAEDRTESMKQLVHDQQQLIDTLRNRLTGLEKEVEVQKSLNTELRLNQEQHIREMETTLQRERGQWEAWANHLEAEIGYLRKELVFKEQKLQEIVSKLLAVETSKALTDPNKKNGSGEGEEERPVARLAGRRSKIKIENLQKQLVMLERRLSEKEMENLQLKQMSPSASLASLPSAASPSGSASHLPGRPRPISTAGGLGLPDPNPFPPTPLTSMDSIQRPRTPLSTDGGGTPGNRSPSPALSPTRTKVVSPGGGMSPLHSKALTAGGHSPALSRPRSHTTLPANDNMYRVEQTLGAQHHLQQQQRYHAPAKLVEPGSPQRHRPLPTHNKPSRTFHVHGREPIGADKSTSVVPYRGANQPKTYGVTTGAPGGRFRALTQGPELQVATRETSHPPTEAGMMVTQNSRKPAKPRPVSFHAPLLQTKGLLKHPTLGSTGTPPRSADDPVLGTAGANGNGGGSGKPNTLVATSGGTGSSLQRFLRFGTGLGKSTLMAGKNRGDSYR